MKSRDFCYWLQGFFELRAKDEPMTAEQIACVERHLAMVFVHEIDPSFPDGEKLDAVHAPPKSPRLKDVIAAVRRDDWIDRWSREWLISAGCRCYWIWNLVGGIGEEHRRHPPLCAWCDQHAHPSKPGPMDPTGRSL